MDITTGYASIANGRIYYEHSQFGTNTNSVIVFIHGNAGDCRHWDSQFNAFEDQFNVLRYDIRGFGKSSVPVEQKPYSDYEDLATLLDTLNIETVHLVGWSMGAAIALDFSLAYPDRTSSLALVTPWVYGYTSATQQQMAKNTMNAANSIATGTSEVAAGAWMDACFSNTVVDLLAADRFRTIANDYSFWVFSHPNPQKVLEPNASERLSEITAPTLIVTAEHDIPACIEIADLLDRLIQNSDKKVMDNTGHLLHIERPEQVNRYLRDFIQLNETAPNP